MKTEVIHITPTIAEQFLNTNASFQRNLRTKEVKTLSAAMTRGEWVLTHQGVAFDTNGLLIDGQHRLMAIIHSGLSQDMLVVRDVTPDAFKVLDIGAKRSTSDLLAIDKKEAGVVSFFARLQGNARPSPAQCFSLYTEYVDQIKPVVAATHGKKNLFHSAAFQSAAVMQLRLAPHNKEYVLDLFRKMGSLDIDKLPPVAVAAVKNSVNGKLRTGSGSDRAILFSAGMKIFNPTTQQQSTIPSKIADTEPYIRIARDEVRGTI
jgi:hypothetical protein